MLQGCALELGKLNNTTFGASDSAQPVLQNIGNGSDADGNDRIDVAGVTHGKVGGLDKSHPEAQDLSASPPTFISSLAHNADAILKRYGGSAGGSSGNAPEHVPLGEYLPLEAPERPSVFNRLENSYSIDVVSAPVAAVLFSLALDAGVELHPHGRLDAVVTASLADRPLDEILDLLADQADFSWRIQNDVLVVRSEAAYVDTYPVNYLNIHRSTRSSVGLATQVGTINATDSSGSSIANSSQTRIENNSEHDFWTSLEADVQSIIGQVQIADDIDSTLSINREAGLMSLFASPKVHRAMKRYLHLVHGSAQRQVLIEATVVEVALSDKFEAGVDWQVIAKGISGVNAVQALLGAPTVAADTVERIAGPAGLVSLVQQGRSSDVQATLSLLEQFGDVRILSRPRIIAMNNQSSVLKVVDNRVYFTVHVQRRQSEEKDEIITDTEIHTVPVGLVMNVTPQISQSGAVMLNVRPTLSRILGFVNDPNPELALANVRNGVPEIQVREMESMLQVQSGDVAIIGGLMQETQSENDAQLPGLGAIPIIGKFFSRKSREKRQTELLIVLRPTVLGGMRGQKQ